jgi:hypothetical protein
LFSSLIMTSLSKDYWCSSKEFSDDSSKVISWS